MKEIKHLAMAILMVVLFLSCSNNRSDKIRHANEQPIQTNSNKNGVEANAQESITVSDDTETDITLLENDINVKAIFNCYPNSKVKLLTENKKYYRAIYRGERTEVHLMRVEGGEIKADKIFPIEYSDIAAVVEYSEGLLVGINWSGQCKIVTINENLDAISSRIFNYPDGEWTQIDSLSLMPNNTYYAELRTNCGDCGEGIMKYKIRAQLNHKILSSSSEYIGDFRK